MVLTRLFRYRVSWAQLAWFGHRASGIGVLVYLFMHIVETSTVAMGPDVYNTMARFSGTTRAAVGAVGGATATGRLQPHPPTASISNPVAGALRSRDIARIDSVRGSS